MRGFPLFAMWVFALSASAEAQDAVPLQQQPPRFEIEVAEVVLTGVPVSSIRITTHDLDGNFDGSFNGRPLIRGIQVTVHGEDQAIEPFKDGVLELQTDLVLGRRVFITEEEIVVDPDGSRSGRLTVDRIPGWLSLLPPVIAIVLAVWLRNVIVALFAGVWSGAVILAHGNFFQGLMRALDTHLLKELVQPSSDGRPYLASEHSHMLIILFTLCLGSMVGVMVGSGGTTALVNKLARFTKKREHGQVLTWLLGMLIFFDDYANTLLVGSTMRPVTDRLKISREKLAFLVDSTAAPVAGLALISTWVGVEIGYIGDAFRGIAASYENLNLEINAYSIFLATLPYRFYPLLLIVFVWLIAYSGNDFGAMYRAEVRALQLGQVARPGTTGPSVDIEAPPTSSRPRELLRNALIPLCVLLALVVLGLWWTGFEGLESANRLREEIGEPPTAVSLWSILSEAKSEQVLFLSAFFASAAGIASAVVFRSLNLQQAVEVWLNGAKSMFPAVVVLVFAWGIATICDGDHLNTAGFLVEWTQGQLSVRWMPTLVFLLSAGVSFATGSSWATMSLLIPLSISVTFHLLVPLNEADPQHHLMLATIGAVLAGAIFGDHCSPISDTTVLSSAAASCDHLDHVTTQLPYAGSVAAVSLLLGYVPVGFGYQPFILLPLSLVVLYLLVEFLGRSPEQADQPSDESSEAPILPPTVSAADDGDLPDDLLKDLMLDD